MVALISRLQRMDKLEIIFKIHKFLRKKSFYFPDYFIYPVLNYLGFHLIRVFFYEYSNKFIKLFWKYRNLQISMEVEKKGFCAVPDFFDEKTKADFDKHYHSLFAVPVEVLRNKKLLHNHNNQVTRINITSDNFKTHESATFIYNLFKNLKLFREVGSDILNMDLNYGPTIQLEAFKVPIDQTDYYDHNHSLHADRSCHCIRFFYFPDETKKENGTYQYVPFSHHMNLKRIQFEWKKSIRFANQFIQAGFDREKLFEQFNHLERVSEADIKWMNYEVLPLEVKANTMAMSDNRGFHRRGVITPGKGRNLLHFCYYHTHKSYFWYFLWSIWKFIFARELRLYKASVNLK